ncbi:LLM class flavin-dependent oxidoreductase [Streptomyces albogriseolus]|uniref:LLM class flavin-dependent oxidoreductase n=1 Tax=Streptomyces albogriseolus TaxID=1887 RepID=UPI0034605D51
MAEFIYTMRKARKAHGDKVILDDVTLNFLPGAKIGVVGPNGAGKSTVLKIMAGLEQPSNGDAFLTPGYTVGILLQEPPLDESKTVLENVQDGVAEIKGKLDRFNEIAEQMATDYSDALLEEMGKLQEELDHANAWDLDAQLEQAMDALGCPLVTSPNFRHPVTLAKELISLDDISHGRVTLGIGAGGTGFDATALGQEPWTPRERADRFAEFVSLLDRLLTEDAVSYEGDFYAAHEARNIPGCVQRPRLPFAVAATGPRGLRLAARYGQAWVTTGDPKLYEDGTPEQSVQAIRGQVDKLADACAEIGRDVTGLDKILLTGFTPDRGRPLESLDAFVDFAGRHIELGFDEIVLHWPIPDSDFAADQKVFERIAMEAPAQLR